jgi:L-alanine-DL-glutamate epimerase-like enolase superfamily enzyme
VIAARPERWPIAGSFRIARGARKVAEVIECEVTRDGVTGRGEAVPYERYEENVVEVLAQIAIVPGDVARASLPRELGPGAARNALECALLDLEAKQTGRRVWEILEIPEPKPVTTCFTISIDTPEAMAEQARLRASWPVLKVKIAADGGLERVRAVHEAAPRAQLVVDANESLTPETYRALAPELARLGVVMLEQPLPAGGDDALRHLPRPVPVCADESCHVAADVAALAGRYDAINVKLDKTGGLVEALATVSAAREAGLRIMVGCIVGTSLAVAPAVLLTPFADLVDLDAPLLLERDRDPGLVYDGAILHPPPPEVWG